MKRAFWPLVIVCALAGSTARLWNIDFDQRQHLHPDERFWSLTADALARAPAPPQHGTIVGPALDWLDGQRSPANPYRGTESFLYGPLPLSLARGVSGWLHDGVVDGVEPANAIAHGLDAVGIPLIDDAGTPRFDDRFSVDLVGRLLGAIFDTITIVVIALIGRRLGGRTAGVAAAALYAASVIAIQYAHFLGSEPLLGLASALTVLFALRLDRGADARRAATGGLLAGAAAGLAVAVKLTGASLMAVTVAGCVALLARHRRRSDFVRLAAVLLGAAVAFRVFNPSAFNGLGISISRPFADDLRRARELKNLTSPPSFQWADRPLILQPLIWLGGFTIGPGVMLAAGVGALAITAQLTSRRLHRVAASLMTDVGRWCSVVIVTCIVVPFLYVSISTFPTGRYFFPMLPALYATAGLGVAAAARLARRSRGTVRAGATTVAVVSVGLAMVWGVGFVNGVYARTNTRIEASYWIAQNVAPGSVVSSEAWDDGLPLRLPGIDAEGFVGERLNLVGPDDPAKVAVVAEQLGRIDYVIESSSRIWGTVTRLPNRFPSTINFFEALDSGALGFDRVATFRTGISLGPWHLNESGAEEAFSVHDHAEVRIWRKVRPLARNAIVDILDPLAASRALPVQANTASANGLLLSEHERAVNETGPTYNQAFDTTGSNLWHVIAWFVLIEILGLASFMLFFPLLYRLPDAGWGLAKILALGTQASAMFVVAAWLHIELGRPLVLALAAGLVVAGVVSGWRRRSLLAQVLRERRTTLIVVEALSVLTFVAFIALRAMNPDLWHPSRGGEKPFEQALLTAVLRTKTLPVYDPWYANGVLNYYYGGWFLISAPARVLRTSPTMVMNLALAVFASCSAGVAFSLGAAMVNRHPQDESRRARTAGLLAAFFVLVASNAAILEPMWQRMNGTLLRSQVDWWALSRVIPSSVAITEFPAWSFLFGDLHPHVMGIAVLLAVGTLCVVWYGAIVDGRRVDAAVLAVMLGAGIGLIRMTNTWDLPLGFALVVTTVALALVARVPPRRLVLPAGLLIFVVLVVWSPYVRRGEVFDSGFDPATLRTPPSSWLTQFAVFAAVAVLAIMMHLATAFDHSRPVWRWITRSHVTVVGLSLVALGYLAVRPGFEVFEINAALALACAWVAWERWRPSLSREAPGLSPLGPLALTIGWSVLAAVELLTVRNDGGRTNTVFKFWYASWIVLAVGCAVVVAEQLGTRDRTWRRLNRTLVGVALVMSAGFWWIAAPARMDDRISAGGLSLSGEAYLTDEFVFGDGDGRFVPADDIPLVDWIRANVPGIHVVAEAPGADYQWAGRISWLTGLPTPIGWGYHELQQRRPYSASIAERQADGTALYTTTDPGVMAEVLSQYSVDYVVFGTQERLIASAASAQALRSFECLRIVTEANRSTESGVNARELWVATVDRECVTRLRPLLPPPPPTP